MSLGLELEKDQVTTNMKLIYHWRTLFSQASRKKRPFAEFYSRKYIGTNKVSCTGHYKTWTVDHGPWTGLWTGLWTVIWTSLSRYCARTVSQPCYDVMHSDVIFRIIHFAGLPELN